ncbi:MAG: M1 family metallopeptidase, partial [Chloroflexi bacterium]|nr:M1 family metallopeptidase [Chloroflexota bacterium]
MDNVLALAHFYPLIAVYDDEGWNVELPAEFADIVYADSSFYIMRVTAPDGLTLAASGIEIDREDTGDQQIVTFAGGPMRDFYLAAGDDYELMSRTVGETTINSYAPAELAAGAEMTLDFAENALQSFNQRLGPYPFTEFDMVSITTLALGIEYPGIVALSNQLYNPNESVRGIPGRVMLESTVAHEVAHQWFYSVIGNDQLDEPWIDESLTQFATMLYYSDVQGPGGAAGFRESLEGRWARVDGADIPIGLPVGAYSPQEYGAIVYGRGPLFVETLAETMGPEAFEAFLHDYYQTHQWGIATSKSLKQLAEQHCICDLTPLF